MRLKETYRSARRNTILKGFKALWTNKFYYSTAKQKPKQNQEWRALSSQAPAYSMRGTVRALAGSKVAHVSTSIS